MIQSGGGHYKPDRLCPCHLFSAYKEHATAMMSSNDITKAELAHRTLPEDIKKGLSSMLIVPVRVTHQDSLGLSRLNRLTKTRDALCTYRRAMDARYKPRGSLPPH